MVPLASVNPDVAGQMPTCRESPFTSAADVFLLGQQLRGIGIVFLCAGHVLDKNKETSPSFEGPALFVLACNT